MVQFYHDNTQLIGFWLYFHYFYIQIITTKNITSSYWFIILLFWFKKIISVYFFSWLVKIFFYFFYLPVSFYFWVIKNFFDFFYLWFKKFISCQLKIIFFISSIFDLKRFFFIGLYRLFLINYLFDLKILFLSPFLLFFIGSNLLIMSNNSSLDMFLQTLIFLFFAIRFNSFSDRFNIFIL